MVDKTGLEVLANDAMSKFKECLKKRAGGIKNLGKSFLMYDKDKSGKLDINEFEICLNRCGVFGDKKEIKAV